jgi:hypothetical protein
MSTLFSRSLFLSLSIAAALASAGHERQAAAAEAAASPRKVSFDAELGRARKAMRRGVPGRVLTAAHAPFAPAASSFAAPHPATAVLRMATAGAPTLAAPRIVPVVFSGEAQGALISDFTARLTTSSSWSALAQYGVGSGSAAPIVTLTDSAPATWAGTDLAAWVGAKIDASTLPAPDANTVYAIFLPAGTSVSYQLNTFLAPTRTSCVDFDAYHDEAPLASGATAPFVVIPHCASFGGLSGADEVTAAASGQIANAALDPFPINFPAYGDVPFEGSELGIEYGAEVASLCASSATPHARAADIGYTLSRFWSNTAASASHDPCSPSTSDPYFNVAPVVDGTATSLFYAYGRGLSVEPGQQKTIALDLYSDAPTLPWELSVKTVPATGNVQVALDQCRGKNGDVVHLTVSRKPNTYDDVRVMIVSTLGQRTNQATLALGR